jgi:methyltransferase OMS1
VDFPETLLRINKLRKKLLFKAQGDVLEVSIGTGRNLEYYDWGLEGQTGTRKGKGKVTSFTAVDISGEMVEVAREKFSRLVPGDTRARWIVADASKEIPTAQGASDKQGLSGGKKYDTIVQTMGLCSANDPVALLKNLGNCIKEEDGRILLLEHGRGNLEWLNKVLDNFSEAHAKEFGCWWNRDLEKIVSDSGLDIVDMHSIWWHGGTTWWIELRRPRGQSASVVGANPTSSGPHTDEGTKKKWW